MRPATRVPNDRMAGVRRCIRSVSSREAHDINCMVSKPLLSGTLPLTIQRSAITSVRYNKATSNTTLTATTTGRLKALPEAKSLHCTTKRIMPSEASSMNRKREKLR